MCTLPVTCGLCRMSLESRCVDRNHHLAHACMQLEVKYACNSAMEWSDAVVRHAGTKEILRVGNSART
jgi:hypothetical protein